MAILLLIGGAYIELADGHLNSAGQPLPKSVVSLLDDVAGSFHALGLLVNHVIIGPAWHPFSYYWLESFRANYGLNQHTLYDGHDDMIGWNVAEGGNAPRYSLEVRQAWRPARASLDASEPPDWSQAIDIHFAGSWLHTGGATGGAGLALPAPPPTEAEIARVVLGAAQALGRELVNRDGDLYLTGVAPVIEALPDPDAAWVALLRVLFADLGLAGQVRSVTRHRILDDDGFDFYVTRPAEAEAMLGPGRPGAAWFAHPASADGGRSAWLLGETVTPASVDRDPALPAPAAVAAWLAGSYEVLSGVRGGQGLWRGTAGLA